MSAGSLQARVTGPDRASAPPHPAAPPLAPVPPTPPHPAAPPLVPRPSSRVLASYSFRIESAAFQPVMRLIPTPPFWLPFHISLKAPSPMKPPAVV